VRESIWWKHTEGYTIKQWRDREGGSGFLQGERAANTFNNKERVYSRAIAFSNPRCSVLLESTLPNISAMYIKLIYMCIA
jgi:hypothetical protein